METIKEWIKIGVVTTIIGVLLLCTVILIVSGKLERLIGPEKFDKGLEGKAIFKAENIRLYKIESPTTICYVTDKYKQPATSFCTQKGTPTATIPSKASSLKNDF